MLHLSKCIYRIMCVQFHFPSLHIYFTKIILIMIRDTLSHPERKRFRVARMENPQKRKKNQLKKNNNIWLRAREILQMRNKLKFKKWKKTKITKMNQKKKN